MQGLMHGIFLVNTTYSSLLCTLVSAAALHAALQAKALEARMTVRMDGGRNGKL